MSTSFKVVRLRWWNKPVPLLFRNEKREHIRIGWVWNQRAYLVKNLHIGWVAFADQQNAEHVDHWFCRDCGASIWGSQRWAIEARGKEEA
jgi:hypothetical protein